MQLMTRSMRKIRVTSVVYPPFNNIRSHSQVVRPQVILRVNVRHKIVPYPPLFTGNVCIFTDLKGGYVFGKLHVNMSLGLWCEVWSQYQRRQNLDVCNYRVILKVNVRHKIVPHPALFTGNIFIFTDLKGGYVFGKLHVNMSLGLRCEVWSQYQRRQNSDRMFLSRT